MPTIPPPPTATGGTRRVAAPPPPPGAAGSTPPGGGSSTSPAPATNQERRELTFDDLPPGFEPRDGDVLHVTYGSVKLPLPNGRVGMIEVAGESYTRTLRAGDNLGETHSKIYSWLKARAERAAHDKVQTWYAQFNGNGASK